MEEKSEILSQLEKINQKIDSLDSRLKKEDNLLYCVGLYEEDGKNIICKSINYFALVVAASVISNLRFKKI